MRLRLEEDLAAAFQGLGAWLLLAEDVEVRRRHEALPAYKEEAFARLREGHDLETLKDEPRIRAYRDFFWRVGIDPTKVRPAAEALLRRVLRGRDIPRINTLVDAYNLASMETQVALAAFDRGSLHGDLVMRFAREGEAFLGIGMDEPVRLGGKEVVVEDDEGLVAVYPYRDAERTKVTPATTAAILMVCGVPNLPAEALDDGTARTTELVGRFCGGVVASLPG